MTKIEFIEVIQELVQRAVRIIGIAVLAMTIISFIGQIITAKPRQSIVVTMNPDAQSETYFVSHDESNFIKIATDGSKTITHVDTRRLWRMLFMIGGSLVLVFFPKQVTSYLIPKPSSNKSHHATTGSGGDCDD